MKKTIVIIIMALMCNTSFVEKTQAQIPILDIIKAGIKKVIKAVDLKIQRLQNETIWLQNAQKVIENTMSKLQLDGIGNWVDKQKTLYKDYFDELSKVKAIISYYQRIKDITEKQTGMVESYKHSWGLIKQDRHFTEKELEYMVNVYSGILDESINNLNQILMVINSFATQMSDAKRMEIINAAADKVDENYSDLQRFNKENALLSLQRSKDENDMLVTKALYGLP